MNDGDAIDLIRAALACDWLQVDSQPIVALSDGRVVSEELLVRIRDTDGHLVPPGAFIPAAERYGLMAEIDRYVIERAASLASTGRHVHVNLSATTIAQRGLFDDVVAAVQKHGAAPAQITFEITETAAAVDLTEASHLATRLAARGFCIALDDFGTGWGAFRYLKALPVSLIKIDCEFVRDLTSSPRTVELVGAIVTLARMLGHETVGEGVENEATLCLLRSLGVDYAQGYYLGKPEPAESSVS
jgi:EAL domain-containing protein (putative c-di-GMP-specific phosphodiesterase class I)